MTSTAPTFFTVNEPTWAELIPDDQWSVLEAGRQALEQAEAQFLLGGALALATYTGRWRNTKDIDFIIREADRVRAVQAFRAAGFDDYYEHEPYDRSWIFRAFRNGVIFDLIWALPNHRVEVDDPWFTHARPLRMRGVTFQVVPIEELVRVKLYVMQRERCDWVDVLNALAGSHEIIEWNHLLERMGRDLSLLQSVLVLFNWLCPKRAASLPPAIRNQFALPRIEGDDLTEMEVRRVRLLDSRPWFAAYQPADQPLER